MGRNDPAARLGPYAQELLENAYARENFRNGVEKLQAAYRRAQAASRADPRRTAPPAGPLGGAVDGGSRSCAAKPSPGARASLGNSARRDRRARRRGGSSCALGEGTARRAAGGLATDRV